MKQFCIVPTNCEHFWSFVKELLLDEHDKAVLQQATIQEVKIDPQTNSWEIYFQASDVVSEKTLRITAEALCENCGLTGVSFHQAELDMRSYLEQNWDGFAQAIAGGNPILRRSLVQAQYTLDESKLSIVLGAGFSAKLLEKHPIDGKIRSWLRERFSKNVEVVCAVGESKKQDIKQDLMTDAYVEAIQENRSSAPTTKSKSAVNGDIIHGRKIKGDARSIGTILEEDRDVIVIGHLSKIEEKELRTGRFLLTYDISDTTNGLSCKMFFEEKEKFEKVKGALKAGMKVKLKGTAKEDKFNNDMVLFVDHINLEKEDVREDTAEVKRVELHAHTQMSNMDAVVSAKALVSTAAKWGHRAVAITDHGVVQAFPDAFSTSSKAGIKVIYGMEGYLFNDDIKNAYHIIILAKNRVGLRNLYRLVSISHLKYLFRTPRIPKAILSEHREGLILGSACEAGELIQAIVNGAPEEKLLEIASYYDYLEIQPSGNNDFMLRKNIVDSPEALDNINRKVCELGTKLGKRVVATCDVHFLNPEDEIYRRILMKGKGFDDADYQPPLYFRTTEEMLAEFQYLGKEKAYEVVVKNSNAIADEIEVIKPFPNALYSPQIPGAEEQIKSMSYAKARQLYGDPLPKLVEDRLEYELNSIINNGFAVLYLIAHKLVKKSLDDGYLVGSRGSVGSSFVAYATNITEVNSLPPHYRCADCKHSEFIDDGSFGAGFDLPDKDCPNCGKRMVKDGHNIPFAVFMGFKGDKVPDIDLNFSGDYQPVAHKYTEELFGRDNVFRAGTIATVADKTAYGYVKKYFDEKALPVRDAFINGVVQGCTGVKRTTGQHPGGIMVVPRNMDVHHFTPIQHPADDKDSTTITSHFDYHSIHDCLVKLDILGHDDPTVIKLLEDLTNRDPKTIPFDDADTMKLFSSTESLGISPDDLGSQVATYGIPEFGTKFVRQMLVDTMPKTFSELVRISGFSHGTDVWLNNAQDLIVSGTAKLSEAISARGDIMNYLIQKGMEPSLAFKIMEKVRKGKGVEPENVAKMRESNVPEWYIESCQKIKYMFPKAHAVAYVMMAFRIAYCKVHYPLAFYAAYCTVRATEFDADIAVQGQRAIKNKLVEFEQRGGNALSVKEKGLQTTLEILLEMYLRGYYIVRVDLNKSDAERFIIEDDHLIMPFAALEGVGANAAKGIVEARNDAPFSSIEDVRVRSHISKSAIEIMRQHGCFEGMTETDQMMLF